MTGCFAASQSPLQSTNNPNPAVNPEDGMSGDKEPTAGIMGAPVTSRPTVGSEINIHQLLALTLLVSTMSFASSGYFFGMLT